MSLSLTILSLFFRRCSELNQNGKETWIFRDFSFGFICMTDILSGSKRIIWLKVHMQPENQFSSNCRNFLEYLFYINAALFSYMINAINNTIRCANRCDWLVVHNRLWILWNDGGNECESSQIIRVVIGLQNNNVKNDSKFWFAIEKEKTKVSSTTTIEKSSLNSSWRRRKNRCLSLLHTHIHRFADRLIINILITQSYKRIYQA